MELLKLALILLIAAQAPNVPKDLQNQAILVAKYAIEQAQIAPVSTPTSSDGILPIQVATSTQKGQKSAVLEQNNPVVGYMPNGTPIYKGTGTFIIGTDGCHYSVTTETKSISSALKSWCPEK